MKPRAEILAQLPPSFEKGWTEKGLQLDFANDLTSHMLTKGCLIKNHRALYGLLRYTDYWLQLRVDPQFVLELVTEENGGKQLDATIQNIRSLSREKNPSLDLLRTHFHEYAVILFNGDEQSFNRFKDMLRYAMGE